LFSSPPAAAPSSGGGLSGALLGAIQQGKSLKKVQTVDKSTPPVAGIPVFITINIRTCDLILSIRRAFVFYAFFT
jgi:hypothetical protein